jgi:hypothetical protein
MTSYLSDSYELIEILKNLGFFSRVENYHYDTILQEMKLILQGQYYQYNPIPETKTVFFHLIDQVPEFERFYENVSICDIPFKLDFFKQAYKYWLNMQSEEITKKLYTFIPTHNVFDILPSADILAFLYSMGRDPTKDLIRLKVDYQFLLRTFAFGEFTDFKKYLRYSARYRDQLQIKDHPKKFNLQYDEPTIQSINVILDFCRMIGNVPNRDTTKLSIQIMKQKYNLTHLMDNKALNNSDNYVFSDILNDFFIL